MAAPRHITPHEKNVALRLKHIYTTKKAELNLTQAKLAEILDMQQGTVAQYLNGHIALRKGATLAKFANALHVAPNEIDPSFKTHFSAPNPVKEVMKDSRGRNVEAEHCFNLQEGQQLLLLDTAYPGYEKGTLLLLDSRKPLKQGKQIAIGLEKRKTIIGRYNSVTARSLYYTRNGDEEPERMDLRDTKFVLPIAAIQLP